MKSRLVGAVCAPLISLAALCGPVHSEAATFSNSNFTMLEPSGQTFAGTNDIVANWDETLNSSVTDTNFNMTMGSASDFPFFGKTWTAHHIRVFGPGSYTFDSSCTVDQLVSGQAVCGSGPSLNLNVGENQVGAHLLWDWDYQNTTNVDIVLLWDFDGVFTSSGLNSNLYVGPANQGPSFDTLYQLVSRDVDGDGIAGGKMVEGPFFDPVYGAFSANFNLGPVPVPVPSALWLFGSGLLGVIGMARRRKA